MNFVLHSGTPSHSLFGSMSDLSLWQVILTRRVNLLKKLPWPRGYLHEYVYRFGSLAAAFFDHTPVEDNFTTL